MVSHVNLSTTENTFEKALRIQASVDAVSQFTGALVVDGGVGISGYQGCVKTGRFKQRNVVITTSLLRQLHNPAYNLFVRSAYHLSDERMKRNIRPISRALWRVCRMRGCQFQWTEGNPQHGEDVGVIAQDVRRVAPVCVHHDPTSGLHSVEYTRLIPYLIESIKTLERRYTRLKHAFFSRNGHIFTTKANGSNIHLLAKRPRLRRQKTTFAS